MNPTKITAANIIETEGERYRSLVEVSVDPLIFMDLKGGIIELNTAFEKITGLNRSELKHTCLYDYFVDADKIASLRDSVFAEGPLNNWPSTLKHSSGKLTEVLFNASAHQNNEGKISGIVAVIRDVSEQKRFEREMLEAKSNSEREKQFAEEAMKAKQQFLSNMSHEIRTPLNAMIGFTKVMLKTELSEKQKEYLSAIKISGDALIVLINDILDLAKVEAGKMTFEQIPFKLSDSISSMLHLFETKLFKKKINLVKEYDHSIPEFLVGDPVRLNQIILNLVGNAVKFTSEGKITVSVQLLSEDDDHVNIEFAVSDTGIGIAENELLSIFDNFKQASGETARLYGGTGLGLAIVKQLVSQQGGNIEVKSKPGLGSKFSFRLNYKKTKESGQKAEENTPIETGTSTGGPVKILVAEDVSLNQLLIKTLLKEFGFEHEIAGNGKIAIEKLQKEKFDLVLMDLQMPVMNGYEATIHIRNTMKLNVPIIALTADVTTSDVKKCRAIGMNDYLAKPIDDKLLYNKILRHVQKAGRVEKNKTGERVLEDKPQKSVNLNYLKNHTNGDQALIKEMIMIYLDETPKLLSAMKQSASSKNWEALGEAVHNIIPTFSIMGIGKEYEDMAKKIKEHAAKKQEPTLINNLVKEIENVCRLAVQELQVELRTM